MNKKQPTKQELSEYDKRVQSMKIASSHSKGCHSESLIKLAERIHGFITGTGPKSKAGDYV